MTDTKILTRTERMVQESRACVELAYLPGKQEELQRRFMDAESAPADNAVALVNLIGLAHAAHEIARLGEAGSFQPWYRDMGQRLLCRAMDAISVLEADNREPDAGLN